MAAPTFVAEVESLFNSNTTPKTSPTIAGVAGDVIVVVGLSSGHGTTLGTPTNTGTAQTWTLRQSVVVTNYAPLYIWTTTLTVTQNFTVSVARSAGTDWYGISVHQYRGSDGVGLSGKANASGAPSLTTGSLSADSAVVIGSVDWNAADGTSRTWRNVNGSPATESAYFRDASWYTLYVARALAGAAGTETVGLSAPAGQKYSLGYVEILGSAASGYSGSAALSGSGALSAVAAVAFSAAVALSGAGTLGASGNPTAARGVSLTGSGSLSASGAPATARTAALSGSGALAATATPGVTVTGSLTGSGTLSAGSSSSAGAATLTGSGTLTATGAPTAARTVNLTGSGALTTTRTPATARSVTLTGLGSLSATGSSTAAASVSVNLAGTGSLTASGIPTALTFAALTGTGALAASGSGSGGPVPTVPADPSHTTLAPGGPPITVAPMRAVTIAPTPTTATTAPSGRAVTIAPEDL